jgi:ABC-type spermidine/putrescine transport system permease subunit II
VLQLATPEIACAAGVALLLTNLSVSLSTWTVIMAHITFGLIYVAMVVRSRLVGMNREIEDAARDLGASEFATLRLIVLPMLWPAVIGSMLLVFVLSFGDFVTTFFTAGVDNPPLPLLIYGMARRGISPEVNAIGVAMIVVTVGCAALAAALLFVRGQRARSTESHHRE